MAAATATAAAANTDRALIATGGGWELDVLITLAGDYVTGGVACDFGPFFSQQGQGIVDKVSIDPTAGYVLEYNYTTKKIVIRMGDNNNASDAPGVEHAAATLDTALTSSAIRAYVRGR
jgi:hypothetical protein